MSLCIQIDEIDPPGLFCRGLVSIRGWCLDEKSAPCRELLCRVGRFLLPVSREWRPDLADAFPGNKESGWGGFRVLCEIAFGVRNIELVADGKRIWRRRIFSPGIARVGEERIWRLGGVPGVSSVIMGPDSRPVAAAGCGTGGVSSGRAVVGPAETEPSVDVVGVFHSRPPSAEKWFQSLAAARRGLRELRLVVIEHGKEPVVRDLVEKWENRLSIQWRHNPANPGFGAGCNAGVSLGRAPFVFLLNPDAVPAPGTLERLAGRAVLQSREGFVGWEAGQMPWEHPKLYHPLSGETEWSSAAAWLIRRDAFEAVGGFDGNIFLYGEDVDLSWRLRAEGGRLAYVPDAPVSHESYGEHEVATGKPLQVSEGRRSDAYLRGKFGRRGERSGFRPGASQRPAFREGLARRQPGATRVSRFLRHGYEVERPGCGVIPLRSAGIAPSVLLRVRETDGGFEREIWETAVSRMKGARVRLEWGMSDSGAEWDREEWVIDAFGNWLFFSDAFAQMAMAAEDAGLRAVRGVGLEVCGEFRGDVWRMRRFVTRAPHPDSGHGFRPGVLRRKDSGEVRDLPKAFWLENRSAPPGDLP